MVVLMFGWEFPPHISGGLGTACYGLTRGLSELGTTGVTFVVPRAWGDEDPAGMQLLGANRFPVTRSHLDRMKGTPDMEYLEVSSELIPYTTPEEFWLLKTGKYKPESRFVEVTAEGTIGFSGGYGGDLFREIRAYAVVAAGIAAGRDFDLIHAHDWLTFPAGIAAKKASGKPLVIHVHATEYDRSGGAVNTAVYSVEREGMEMADRIITVSNLTRQTVIEKYGISPGKVTTVHNAADDPAEHSPQEGGKGLAWPVVTFLGRITCQKGPEYFVEAAALVLKKMKQVRFVMAGDGDLMPAMVEHTARLGISDRFHFTGFLMGEEVRHLLRISDVLIMPSVSEPFGIVPLEAMQAGVPVIISRQSGVAEVLSHALKVDFWDTFAIADAIYGLLNYPALPRLFIRQGTGEAGNLKWIDAAREVYAVYQSLLDEVKNDVHWESAPEKGAIPVKPNP